MTKSPKVRLVWTGLRLPETPPPEWLDVSHQPATVVTPLPIDGNNLHVVLRAEAVVFTSRTAVELFPKNEELGAAIFAAGEGTARDLARWLKRRILSPLKPGVAGLSRLIDSVGVRDVTVLTVADSTNRLVGDFTLHELPIYKAEFVGVKQQPCDAIVVTSPKAAECVSRWETRPMTFVYGADAKTHVKDGVPIDEISDAWQVIARTLDFSTDPPESAPD